MSFATKREWRTTEDGLWRILHKTPRDVLRHRSHPVGVSPGIAIKHTLTHKTVRKDGQLDVALGVRGKVWKCYRLLRRRQSCKIASLTWPVRRRSVSPLVLVYFNSTHLPPMTHSTVELRNPEPNTRVYGVFNRVEVVIS